jgi:hypothetical protein
MAHSDLPASTPTREDLEFLARLRTEVMHHKKQRAAFVLRKLVFVTTFFGLGTLQFTQDEVFSFGWLLLAVPFVALAFDVYINAEHYKVKRIGAFYRIHTSTRQSERDWEKYVQIHLERTAVVASGVVTGIAFVGSGFSALRAMKLSSGTTLPSQDLMAFPLIIVWAALVLVLMAVVFGYSDWQLKQLPRGHLSPRQSDALVRAPTNQSAVSEEQKQILGEERLILLLMLHTGIRPVELSRLRWTDVSPVGLRVRKRPLRVERFIPYSEPETVLSALVGLVNNTDEYVFCNPGWGKRIRKRINSCQVRRVLKKHPIVLDGDIRRVTYQELRRTYARRLYAQGAELSTIEQRLGVTRRQPPKAQPWLEYVRLRRVLGYVGRLQLERTAEEE